MSNSGIVTHSSTNTEEKKNKMDSVAKNILHFIQTLEGRENSVIAGGAVRDEIYNLVPNDYDICVPSTGKKDMIDLANSVQKEFAIKPSLKSKTEYHQSANGQKLTTVWSMEFEGRKIDFIGYREDPEDFASNVVRSFDYGLNMVYFDGSVIVKDNDHFYYDRDCHTMSLINLEDMSCLPNAMYRFMKFSNRLNEPLGFRAPCLSLRREEKSKKVNLSEKSPFANLYGGQTQTTGLLNTGWAPPAPAWDIPEDGTETEQPDIQWGAPVPTPTPQVDAMFTAIDNENDF